MEYIISGPGKSIQLHELPQLGTGAVIYQPQTRCTHCNSSDIEVIRAHKGIESRVVNRLCKQCGDSFE